jgi:hypothetical protein
LPKLGIRCEHVGCWGCVHGHADGVGVMRTGWIKLHRKSMDSMAHQTPNLWYVWTWCLMKASSCDRWTSIKTGRGEMPVKIEEGQFIFGRHAASKELHLPGSTIADLMKKLTKAGNIVMQPVTHYSVVTICNWQTYQHTETAVRQASRQPTVNQPSTNRQPTVTVEECKEVREC